MCSKLCSFGRPEEWSEERLDGTSLSTSCARHCVSHNDEVERRTTRDNRKGLTPATAAARQRGPASGASELLALVMRHWLAHIHTNSFEHVLAHLLADGFASLLLRFQKVRVAIGIDCHCF